MRAVSHRRLTLLVVGLALATFTPPARSEAAVRFRRLHAFQAPGTPARLDKVGVLEIGPRSARNVLVLNPGTSASAAYFAPLAKTVVSKAKGWQVWAVERRENQLEDHSVLDRAKQGKVTGQELFDYYLGWLTNPSVTTHFQFSPDSDVGFARECGMRVEIGDLRRVVKAAKRRGGRVVLGGHSLGGSITAAYATWDFDGEPGAKDLSGLVFIDGGSSPTPVSAEQATAALQALQGGSPWLSFGGIPAPLAGLFNAAGRLDGRAHRSGLAFHRAGLAASPGQPEAPDPGHEPGPVRVRARHGDVAPEPDCGPGAPRSARRERRSTWLGPGGRDNPDPALCADVLRDGSEEPGRHRVVPPATPDHRLGGGRRRKRQPGAEHPRRPIYAWSRSAETSSHLRLRRRARRAAGRRRCDPPRQPVEHSAAEPDAHRPPRDVRPQRPQLRESAERLRGRAGAVPGAGQAGQAPLRVRALSLASATAEDGGRPGHRAGRWARSPRDWRRLEPVLPW